MNAARIFLAVVAASALLGICGRPAAAQQGGYAPAYGGYDGYGQDAPQAPYPGDSTTVYGGGTPAPYSRSPSYDEAPPPYAGPGYTAPPPYAGPPQPYAAPTPPPDYASPPYAAPPQPYAAPATDRAPPPPAASTAGQDLVQTMQDSGQYGTFLQLADAAGFTDALHRGGPYTVFAPTDAAFQRLPQGTVRNMLNSRGTAISFVRFHIVQGTLRVTDLLSAGQPLQTLQGNTLQIGRSTGHVTVNGAAVIAPDLVAANGVVQGLSAFALPVYPGALEGRQEPEHGQNSPAPTPGGSTPPAPVPSAPPAMPTPPKTGAYPPADPGGPAYYR